MTVTEEFYDPAVLFYNKNYDDIEVNPLWGAQRLYWFEKLIGNDDSILNLTAHINLKEALTDYICYIIGYKLDKIM